MINTIIIVLAMFIMISGCQYRPESSEASSIPAVSNPISSVANSIPDVSSTPSIPLGSSYTLEEYKMILQPYLNKDEFINFVRAYNVYSSPDGKNQYIEIETCIGYLGQDLTNYVNYLFFNDFDHFVTDYSYTVVKKVKWIDNHRALIDHEILIDNETGHKKNIMENSYFANIKRNYIVESSVNAAGTQIATFNRYHSDGEDEMKPSMQYLYLYDIAEDKWQLLYETQYLYQDTREPSALLKWKTEDCIEFYLHYGAKFNYTISSGEIFEVSNFVVEDNDVFNAARLKKDEGFAGEKTIYIWKVYTEKGTIDTFVNLCTYMEENNLKIAPGEYCIHNNDSYEDLIGKLVFVPNK